MKFLQINLAIQFFIWLPAYLTAQNSLSGTITEIGSNEVLQGATIYFPDLKTGAVSDENGYYEIKNLPAAKLLIQVTYLGYEAVTETIDLSFISTKDFHLKPSITEIRELVVTGLSKATEQNQTPTPISIVSHTDLLHNNSTNLIDALAKQPGISQVTTGPAISKPEIRGLGYNRVVVVNDGIKQEGQQWGDEHGIEIDEYSVNKIEILKGPASLAYGSDAMAGVINLISAPALPYNSIKGNLFINYQTNNGLIGYSGNIAGNMNGFIWNARYSGKYAHAYRNKYDGYVFGSNFRENAASAILGLNKKWGYSHLHLGYYSLTPGIVEGERDEITGEFVKPVAISDTTAGEVPVTEEDSKSYTVTIPHQEIRHFKAVLNNSFILGNGSIKTTLGFQENNRKEFDDILSPDLFGLYFKLNTISYDVRYLFPDKINWQTSLGVNGMQQNSSNEGSEFLVPAYQLFDAGLFIMAKRSSEKLNISGGIRYDIRYIISEEFFHPDGAELLFAGFTSTFTAISGSIGATYQFNSELLGKLNVSRGFRAPNIAELGANGIHEGTFRFECGDPDLVSETSLQLDAALGFDGEHISVEADVFNNRINNFIYLRKLNAIAGGDSIIIADGEDVAVFKYVQGDANLAGAEITVDIHPHPMHWLHFENSLSFVEAVQLNATDSTKYLPFSPAPKLISEIRGEARQLNKFFGNSYFSIQVENYFSQEHIYSAYGTETETPAYTLLNLGAGTDILSNNKVIFSVFLNLNNLTDVAYQSHLSRLKYAPVNHATGRPGVYGMGRNFSIKLNVPLYLKS